MGDYFITVPLKMRVYDTARMKEAAKEELARLRKRYPDDWTLETHERDVNRSNIGSLRWLLSGTRLQYLYGGVEVLLELASVTAAEHFSPELDGDHLHDWWIEQVPEHVIAPAASESSNLPVQNMTMRVAGADDNAELEAFTIGLAENADGSGFSLLFSAGDIDTDNVDESYCVTSPYGADYGGVRECSLHGSELRLVVAPETANVLGVESTVSFHLDLSDDQLELLRQGLRRVLSYGDPARRPRLHL